MVVFGRVNRTLNEIKIDKPAKVRGITKDKFEKIGIGAIESFKKGF